MLLSVAAQAYDWNSVAIKANGYIDGIVYNPAAPNTVYIHTDMGGAYRWDQSLNKWMPLNDWLQINDSASNNGAESLAVDPTDANRVYMVSGTYQSTAAILRSSDGGRTWLRTNVSGIQVDGNGYGRNVGERMAVDPNLPSIVYYGARYYDSSHRGLWKSTDYAATWNQVASFTNYGDIKDKDGDGNTYELAESVGLPFVVFDKASGTAGSATPRIYVGVATTTSSNTKVYRTSNGGTSWEAIPNQPTTTLIPIRAALSSDDSVMYVTYANQAGPYGGSSGAVYKVTNPSSASPTWTAVSPVSAAFSAIAIDPTNSNIVYAGALSYWPSNIYRSTNGGSSWTALNPNSHRDDSSAAYASSQTVHWLSDLEIDPFNNNVAIFNTGYGLYRTTNLTAATPTWSFFNDGFEQVADLELNSPNTGSVHLLSAIGDRDGYRHDDFSQSPSIGLFGQSNGLAEGTSPDVDSAFNDANYVVRVTNVSPYVQYSVNNGIDWAWMSSTGMAGSTGGNVAISADGTKVVYEPGGTGQVIYSTRSGSTWSSWSVPATNRPANGANIVADLVGSQTFYAYVGTTVSRSTDGGANWTVMTSSAPSGGGWIRALPGQAGNLVMSRGSNGLWRSTNGGATWSQLASGVVTTANQVGVGMGPTSGSYPSIFVGGTVSGQNGFFRSDDQGATWVQISDLAHQYGWVTVIQGDPRVYGRLYVGTNGRGILYADIHTPQTTLPTGWSTQDVGVPGSTGSAGSPYSDNWELIGGGAGIAGTADTFRFAYTSFTGDGSITARVMGVPSDNPSNHNAKAGVMIRDGVGIGAANVFLAMSPGSINGAFFQYRSASGGATTISTNPGIWSPYWVRLTRSGNTFTAYRSADGDTWTLVGTAIVTMGATVDFGLAVTASDNNQLDISTFQNVSVTTPTHTWDGGSLVNNLWTTPENWDGDVPPLAGDNMIFPAGAAQLENVNDYPSTTVFGSITLSGSGYHFISGEATSTSISVESGATLETNSIVTGMLTIGAGSVVTITSIPGGPLAANRALTPLATDALLPNQPKTVTQPTAANTIAPLSATNTTVAPGPLAASTVIAMRVPASSEAASALTSSDSLSNTVLDAVATPTGIIADTALPVCLVESTPARLIDTDFNRLLPQSPIYFRLDSTALHKIIESGLEQSLTARNGNITSTPLLGSLHDELPSRASMFEKHPTISALNSRQALLAALQTNSRWAYLDAVADFDIAQHVGARKHSKQFEKAIDEVLAEEETIMALL